MESVSSLWSKVGSQFDSSKLLFPERVRFPEKVIIKKRSTNKDTYQPNTYGFPYLHHCSFWNGCLILGMDFPVQSCHLDCQVGFLLSHLHCGCMQIHSQCHAHQNLIPYLSEQMWILILESPLHFAHQRGDLWQMKVLQAKTMVMIKVKWVCNKSIHQI